MSALRRPRRRARKQTVWEDPTHGEKQQTRELVARTIAKHFGSAPSPTVFVLPSYEALCAKTINRLVPQAIFYGCDYLRPVVEKTDAVAPGKHIHMQRKSVGHYIIDNVMHFDAAFLDYKANYEDKQDEIIAFATKMLKPTAVLAVTAQRGDSNDVIAMMAHDLRGIVEVVLEGHIEYMTSTPMVHATFLLRRTL